jgi:hypothetical protein
MISRARAGARPSTRDSRRLIFGTLSPIMFSRKEVTLMKGRSPKKEKKKPKGKKK